MERIEFQLKKTKVLRIIAISLTVILSISIIIGLVYARFGIAGLFQNPFISKLLGLDKQQEIVMSAISIKEKNEIIQKLGFDPETVDKKQLTSFKHIEMSLTPQGTAYLIKSLLKSKDTIQNLQIGISNTNGLEVSAVGDVALICEMVGENKAVIESTIGELPDKVPVYAELQTDNQSDNTSISQIKAGMVKIPKSVYTSINGYVDQGIELFFLNAMGIKLKELNVSDQSVNISGNFPSLK